MLGYLQHSIANPFMRAWLATSSQSWRTLPTPTDSPVVHAVGADPDRILLLGSGIAVGYGVVSHDLALGGSLARELSTLTGRGASVDIVASPHMSPRTAAEALTPDVTVRFDAVMLVLGGLESLTLLPPRMWRRRLERLLDRAEAGLSDSAHIFLVQAGAPLVAGLPSLYRPVMRRSSVALNDQSRQACESRTRVTFVPFTPTQGDVSTLKGSSNYQQWAGLIAPPIAERLNRSRVRAATIVDEQSRQLAVNALDLDVLPGGDLDRIVETARDLFGTSGASVTIIDGSQQHTVAAAGLPIESVPRSTALCDITIRDPKILVVEDTMTDPRVTGTPWSDGERIRFYAGYPVESPDGHRVGALCVVDEKPRLFTETDAALLRQLALRVQAVLWEHRTSR